MNRKLTIESLIVASVLPGDIVTNFAQSGEYSISYPASDLSSGQIVDTFAMPDGQLTIVTSNVGSGRSYTLVR